MPRLRNPLHIVALLAVSTCFGARSLPACEPDQVFAPLEPASLATGPWTGTAQTFTVGSSGQLTKIQMYISRNALLDDTLRVELRSTVAGVPDAGGTPLAIREFPSIHVPTDRRFVDWDVSSWNLSVSTGQVLALVLSEKDLPAASFNWFGSNTNAYGAGRVFTWIGSGPWVAQDPAWDLGFSSFVCQQVQVQNATWGQVKAVYR